jgi:protein-tyrosine phosphatase
MQSVLFVCLGNICRSPLAEGIARAWVEEHNLDVLVDSAGTSSWHVGEAPCNNSIVVAKKNGLEIAYLKARQVERKDFERFDLIVALDANNYNDLKNMGAKNLVKLGSYGAGGADVPDPYFFDGLDGFDEVFRMIQECVHTLFKES